MPIGEAPLLMDTCSRSGTTIAPTQCRVNSGHLVQLCPNTYIPARTLCLTCHQNRCFQAYEWSNHPPCLTCRKRSPYQEIPAEDDSSPLRSRRAKSSSTKMISRSTKQQHITLASTHSRCHGLTSVGLDKMLFTSHLLVRIQAIWV